MELKNIVNFINRYWITTILPTWQNISKRDTDRVVKAIQDKEYETLNPSEISNPIVQALQDVQNSIVTKEITEKVQVTNFPEIPDMSPQILSLGEILKTEIGKLDKEVVVKNDLGQLLGIFKSNGDKKDLIKALKRIEERIPTVKENSDYTLLISELIEKIESLNLTVDLSPIVKEVTVLGELFKEQAKKATPIIRGGGGYSSVGVKNAGETRINPATAENQDQLASYKSAGMDISSNPYYFGYINLDGNWYIKNLDTSSGITYCKGASDYTTAWAGRAGLSYGDFNVIF